MSRITSLADSVLKLPVVWGGIAWLVFYALVRSGRITNPTVLRYTDGHPIEYVITALFFVGVAALLIRLIGVTSQSGVQKRALLDPIPAGGQSTDEVATLLEQLDRTPHYLRDTYLVRRLRDALEFVRRNDSADGLDEHLRYLEVSDADRMSLGYAMTRLVVWATPMLGFFGTVMGITLAIANLANLTTSLEEAMPMVVSSLAVAFDTTALALALTLVLMAIKHFVESTEHKLLAAVDRRVEQEIVGRFQRFGATTDPNVASMRRMCEQVTRAVETMATQQAELWKGTIDETHQQWTRVMAACADVLDDRFRSSMTEQLAEHAKLLTAGAEQVNHSVEQAVARHLETLGEGVATQREKLSDQTQQLMGGLKAGLERMAELLVEALQSHGETLTEAEAELASQNRRHLSEVEAALGHAMVAAAERQEKLIEQSETLLGQMQESLVTAAGATIEHQRQLVKQGEVLLKVVDSTGQVRQLEEALSHNLATLGRAHNFEETLLSLSAAIQLLSARVTSTSAAPLRRDTTTGHAA